MELMTFLFLSISIDSIGCFFLITCSCTLEAILFFQRNQTVYFTLFYSIIVNNYGQLLIYSFICFNFRCFVLFRISGWISELTWTLHLSQ